MSLSNLGSTTSPTTSGPPPSSPLWEYDVEFRAPGDDAWYSVRTVLEGEKLRVKYQNFDDEHDNVFDAKGSFKSVQELHDFESRFRPVSQQLQDHECRKVTKGTMVCASHSLTDFDNRFYDAVVDDVILRDHSFGDDGEEECLCTFMVEWLHGPSPGCLSNKKIENVCLVQSCVKLDPIVAYFLTRAREKLESGSWEPILITDNGNSRTYNGGIHPDRTAGWPLTKPKLTFAHQLSEKTKYARHSPLMTWPSEEAQRVGNHSKRIRQDIDVGGHSNHYVVLIDNVDKDLSPTAIVEFIHRQTSVLVQALVFPSLSSETYTNGAIVLNCKKNLENLSEFLDSPNHIVMSSKGRPWVVTEKLCGHEMPVPIMTLIPKYQNKLQHSVGSSNDLKVVCSGSEEYKTAKRLRDLFMDFSEHYQHLHKRLAMEERKILQSSHEV